MRKRLLHRRKWLRPDNGWGPESSLHAHCEIEDNRYNRERKDITHSLDATLSIRDCNNAVTLYFNADCDKYWRIHHRALVKLHDTTAELLRNWENGKEVIEQAGGWAVPASKPDDV